jgi:hypothetical protein
LAAETKSDESADYADFQNIKANKGGGARNKFQALRGNLRKTSAGCRYITAKSSV